MSGKCERVSDCHQTPVRYEGQITRYSVCVECGTPCTPVRVDYPPGEGLLRPLSPSDREALEGLSDRMAETEEADRRTIVIDLSHADGGIHTARLREDCRERGVVVRAVNYVSGAARSALCGARLLLGAFFDNQEAEYADD